MQIYFQNDKIEFESVSIALGNFDGVHIGHMKILENARKAAAYTGVLLFDSHTREDKVITPFDEKLRILAGLGVDFVYVVSFDEKFRSMTLKEFVRFLKQIGVKYISVGYDYRCAKNASSDAYDLKKEALEQGIETVISPTVFSNGKAVKSSDIRSLISCGKIKEANLLMFSPFTISGIVVSGYQNGRKMGFPTANIEPVKEALLPCDGVYLGKAVIDSKSYKAVINVGKNPTLDAKSRTVEGHIIGLNEDLYGERISFIFYDRIRGEMKFSSLDELKEQIEKDKMYALSVDI